MGSPAIMTAKEQFMFLTHELYDTRTRVICKNVVSTLSLESFYPKWQKRIQTLLSDPSRN